MTTDVTSDAAARLQRRLAALQLAYGIEIPEANVPMAKVALVTEAINRAAVSGAFDLYRLTSFVHPNDRDIVRAQVAAASDPAPTGDRRLRWLKSERRCDALGPMLENPAGLPSLLSRVRLDRTDEAGRALRDMLRGWRPDLRRVSLDRLAAIITALSWLEPLPVSPGLTQLPDLRDARMELSRRQRRASRRALLSDGFVGRRRELAAIRRLIDRPEHEDEVLILTGPGGIGKSALLARAARTLANRTTRVPVFLFDFDRPSLDPVGPGLTMEFTRQLSAFCPEAGPELSSIRGLMRETFLAGGGESAEQKSVHESSLRSTSEAGYMIGDVVRRHDLDKIPVLILFDTLEVVAAQGEDSLRALAEWISFCRYTLHLHQARIVVAGRAAEAAAQYFGRVTEYEVPMLSVEDAVRLLILMGVDGARAGPAAEILGGNPLVLRLAGDFLIAHPEAPVTDLREGGAADAALSQGVLYRRILNHVGKGPDDPLRKLAYPGLVLRIVTPALIRDVVAPSLGITLTDDDEADLLWDRLVGQTWLVETETDTRVRHRRDLRAEMLRQMRRDKAIGPVAEQLHQLALDHHRRADDPDMPPDRARREAVYHALMLLPPGSELPKSEVGLVAASLAGEFADLPPHAAALARDYAGAPPRPEDIALVPASRRDAVTAQLGWTAVDGDRPFEALGLEPGASDPWCWRLTAWLMAADWTSDAAASGLARIVPQEETVSWWSEHETRLERMRVAAVEQREQREQVSAAASWLRLARGDIDQSEPNPQDTQGLLRTVVSRISVLRSAAARSLMRMSAGDAPVITQVGLSMVNLITARSSQNEPLLADEIARLELLLWDILKVRRMRVRPASIVATPVQLVRYRELLADSPAHRDMIENLRTGFPENSSVARLTGKLAQDVAEAINDASVDLGQLEAAGFRRVDLARGLMHEFRPGARALLRPVVTRPKAAAVLAGHLPDLLRIDDSGFLPTDLATDSWRAAAGRSDGSRAISALVDWAGRIGRLAGILKTAAALAPDDDSAVRIHRFAEAVQRVDRAIGGSLLS